ncbi:penicillin acylase family protein [Nocardioides bizhenqiangii]|uniref:Penicillin acylase family protein n=1 Tax=Nocardioides bizhenqiangii TaxID=3095076 RepID=A0ABZ0ZS59_9ACTN|nr:penicillin acylase family protein [Nocardioides sp. HM61]WQQ27142.1 penicillin acylase family protein [Nocardioides sp. HM61]
MTAVTRRLRNWPASLRWTMYVAIGLALLLVLVLLVGVIVVRRSWPETSGELEIAGLEGEAEVLRDEHGIPQIYADSLHDLMLAQGFVHAQERFFEMDVRRHATAGRLAELFGEDALETDRVVRTLGWRQVAEQELTLLKPSTRALLDAYAEGVNAYLDDRGLAEISLEYAVLDLSGFDYSPEAWTAVDSIAWLKAMAWDLKGNLEEEIGRARSIGAVGTERAAQLFPPYPYDDHPPIVEQGAVVDGVFEQDATAPGTRLPQRPPLGPRVQEALAGIERVVGEVPALLGAGDGIGSNGWVVGGEHTDTGAPILANDPHLGISLPGVWMQVGLHCREVSDACPLDVGGFSFSGVPGVIIGHNADIAWGFTNLAPDTTDLYVERVRDDRWQHDGRSRPLEVREETIEVRDGDDVTIQVRSTAHGPLLSDLSGELGDLVDEAGDSGVVPDVAERWDDAVSLAWTALDPQPTADALAALNLATDWRSFRAALADFAVPGQNVVYADTEGHIGYQATGRVPIRKSGNDGLLPAAGWRAENDWTGEYVPYDALPNVLDPESGLVVTANQAVVDPASTVSGYPYYLTDDWDRGYRSARIRELLEDDESLDVDDMSSVQLDDRNPMAPKLTPYLLEIELPVDYYSDGQRKLADWDFQQDADSAAAAYYNVVWRELLARTFHDELTGTLRPDGGDRWFAVVTDLLTRPGDRWWDDQATDDVVETRDDILEASLRAARDVLTSRQSPNADEWSWGALHRLELRSSTLGESGIGLIEDLFNRGEWEVGGGGAIPDATGWDAREGYDVATAPSMRMVIPLDDLDAARWVNLTGVSGHAFHAHYVDQTDLWAEGETLPWVFSTDAVEDAAEDTLTLVPTD